MNTEASELNNDKLITNVACIAWFIFGVIFNLRVFYTAGIIHPDSNDVAYPIIMSAIFSSYISLSIKNKKQAIHSVLVAIASICVVYIFDFYNIDIIGVITNKVIAIYKFVNHWLSR